MTSDTPITRDEGDALNAGLARAAQALDREIAASGAVDRITARVMARVAPRHTRRTVWFAIAAALIIAAGLGSLVDIVLISPRAARNQEVVVIDPLILGTTEVNQ